MTVMPLIMDLTASGVFVYVNGKKLVLTPAAKLTNDLRLQVRNNKSELMANLIELQQLPEWDWSTFEVSPARFKAFVEMIMIFEQREQGIVPAHYTASIHCETCAEAVPHFPVDVESVRACVWCLNGQPVPTPNESESAAACRISTAKKEM